MKKHSELLEHAMRLIYPIIIIFALYIMINGHISPGGGFQGGPIITSLFIIHYMAVYKDIIDIERINRLEKILYISLISLVLLYIMYFNKVGWLWLQQVYLIAMNLIIGLEVGLGLTIIFYRYVLYESR